MGKVAIVTGGSRGIGKEIVLNFANQNIKVYYLSRTKGFDSDNPLIKHIQCDMGKADEVESALKTILEEDPKIDILVNNAGITRDGLIMRMSDDAWDEVIKINLTSAFLTSRRIGRAMANNRKGAIINISSVVGIIGNGGQTNYAASKAGLIGFSKSLARELSQRNVRVNVVAPGFIETEMTDVLPTSIKENLNQQIPLGRIGSAQEVASVVSFLATDESSYITGQVIAVDGGMAM